MKVLFDHDVFAAQTHGGISRYIVELYLAMLKLDGCVPKLCAPFTANIYIRDMPSAARSLSALNCLAKLPYAKRLLRDLTHGLVSKYADSDIHHTSYYLRTSATRPSRALVMTLHDLTHELFPSQFSKEDKTAKLKESALKAAHHVICISEVTRQDAIRVYGLDQSKLSVIHHGAIKLPPPCRPPMGLNQRNYLLYVGQRGGYKNFECLLRAFASRSHIRSEFRLVCFGGGAFTGQENALIEQLGLSVNEVLQIGGGDDLLHQAYRGASAFIYPSLYEGFGMPLLEAMSAGCPIFAARAGAIPEVGGDAIIYFDPNKIESLGDCLDNRLFDSEQLSKLRKKGYERVQNFSWERCAKETTAAYRVALSTAASSK